jgi:hypothetical protein
VPHRLRAAQAQERHRDGLGRADGGKKRLIEQAYEQAVAAGSVELNEDEAGPSATRPQPGASWQPEGHPMLQPPEEQRPQSAQWKTWLWPHESAEGLPPLRILLVWENLAAITAKFVSQESQKDNMVHDHLWASGFAGKQ